MTRWLFHQTNVLAIVLIILSISNDSNAHLDNLNVPCSFFDSINITGGDVNSDGSVLFEGISYPKNFHGIYDYEFVDLLHRQDVAPHKRGCSCTMDAKPCVRMCCPRGRNLDLSLGRALTCVEDNGVFNMTVSVFNGAESSTENIFDSFNYVLGKPCRKIIVMSPNEYPKDDTWMLLKNGSILTGNPPTRIIDKNNYCFYAMESNGSFETALITCFMTPPERTKDFWVSVVMFLSIPFLVATIAVYTILPELRNIHGKSLVCYLSGLVVGYITLGLIRLKGEAISDPKLCRTMGYTTYFAFLFSFFWLNVISFDLWRSFWFTFRSRKSNDCKKFFFYSIYAWGSTILMLSISLGVDYSSSVPTKFKPAIGNRHCFLGNTRWSSFLYFYLPLIIISISNLTFFVLTSWKIKTAQREMEKFTSKEESEVYRQNLKKEKSNYGLFMRMFIVMGITWSVEPISWILSSDGGNFLLTDIMNSAEGVIIFILFVARVNVKKLIVKRWQMWRRKVQPKRRVTATVNSVTVVTTMDDNIELLVTSNNNDK